MDADVREIHEDDWLREFLPGPSLPVSFKGVGASFSKTRASECKINIEIVCDVEQSLSHAL